MAKMGLGPSDALNFHKQVGSRLPDDWYKIDADRRNDLPTFGNFILWFTEQTLGRTLENEGNAMPQIAVNAPDRDKSHISSEPSRSKQPTGRKRKRSHFSIAKVDWKAFDAHINNSSLYEDFMQEGGNISPVSAYEDLVKLTKDSFCASGARVKRESGYLRRPSSPW
ncbi:uncharacterized protein LOC112590181 [Harpegnathos saltator]|uniref:uncharacterized protein LOC112590181 n=1 Tax=Harpegnathos saltator TaxID=610380 RepID=UPI000DBED28D|nr:uncharacterized protein LOC112590181 [Harpegnathos saltator]